jgi:4-alpha-glucanotransferase
MTEGREREAGLLLPMFSLRRAGDFGIGDTLALREWIDWAAETGVGFLQLLPINDCGVDSSPYSAVSSVALDPVYLALDGDALPWLKPEVIEKFRQRLGSALHAERVDYPTVRRVKRDLLELAWLEFPVGNTKPAKALAKFRNEEAGWLDDYLVFRHLMDVHGEGTLWSDWPEPCRSVAGARRFLEAERTREPELTEARLGFHAFVQWLCFTQWRELRRHADRKRVKLMGDLPFGVSWHSCDVFFHREQFHLDWFGGVPADGMGGDDPFTRVWGQNWGIPLYRWERMQQDGYAWWKNRVRHLCEVFSMFRLDHVLGFYRIYAFPWHPQRNAEVASMGHDQIAAMTGGRFPQWVKHSDDAPEHKAINLAEGDARLRAVVEAADTAEIIAEDLGWVPDYVRPHLTNLGIAGYRIPHWDCNEWGHPVQGRDYPWLSLATYSTHDHDPVSGIWRQCHEAIQRQRENPSEAHYHAAQGAANALRILSEFAGIPQGVDGTWPPFTEGVRLKLIKALFDSNSRYAVIVITSLFGMLDRINRPGTAHFENWTFRLPWSLREILTDPKGSDVVRKLATAIRLSGRAK